MCDLRSTVRPGVLSARLFILVSLLSFALNPTAAIATEKPTARGLDAALDTYVRARVAVSNFSGTVLVARHGRILLSRGYGLANREWDMPNAPNTKFMIGSLTKQFTATLIMQLQERHQLEVTDKVCKYIDPCPATWSAVTLRELLSHTSGIPNFTDDADFKRTDILPRTVEQLIAIFRDKPLEFVPGTSWKYSNSGYVLLGAIIERVTSKRYEDVLSEQILEPLGMNDSGYDRHEPILSHRASGYVLLKGQILNAPYVETSWAYAEGAMYSTTLDLYRWDQALYTNKILPQSALKEMWTPVREVYGYGWGIVQSGTAAKKHLELTHDGGIDGFRAHISRFPDDGTVVIVLANTETPAPLAAIGIALAAIVFGEPYLHLVKPDRTVNVSMFDRYLGDYDVGDNNILRIARIGDEIRVQILDAPDQPTFLATPLSSTRLLVDDLGGTFDFSGGHDATIIAKAPGEKQRAGRRISAGQE